MMEYLIGVKGWTYTKILEDKTSEDVIFAEVVAWSKS